MPIRSFHPAVADWFGSRFDAPTEVQLRAWPSILRRQHTLLAAPTGSGKTLAAFLTAIDELVREGLERGLTDETRVLYVSPLKALSNDIQKNLQDPLQGIREELLKRGLTDLEIRAWVRTGDTPQSERARMRRVPPHILVTTPESLYILLTSDSGRDMLSTVRTVIVDELHAVAGNKRGSHLSLSLERLEALCSQSPLRIGISATQKPIARMANFLLGNRPEVCEIVDAGFVREWDLALELPSSPLQAVMAIEVWDEIYTRLAELIESHRTTLIFVNTRRMAERVARHLAERLGEENVTSHHGSLAREHRLDAERRLKDGSLRALVATASLELGIDIGQVDLTCQLGSPRSIAAFLQRVGRSGHGVDAVPQGRLFPLSRDDLVECAALLDAVRHRELDEVRVPRFPLDVLSQQLVAEVSAREWVIDDLFTAFTKAWPYHELPRAEFDRLIRMLADGFSTRRGRRGAHLHLDAVNGRVRPRKGARLMAITNGGAIPDQFDYDVVLLPQQISVGTLNEDFAFESLPGDIFQLGNTSYRILRLESGKVLVEDAKGQPPNIPFWFGEAPGRSDELSVAVSRLRQHVEVLLETGQGSSSNWLQEHLGLPAAAAEQLTDYLAGARAALSVLPTQQTIILERFFDEVGDTHLVIHSPFGSRLNRAWGLALRKRFCRKFNFELQAAALEDSIVLSLGPTHSFPLDEVAGYLNAATVRDVLVQALLAAPMFPTHWRWSSTIALAVRRNRNGKKVPPQFQRSDAEDLLAVVFPDQLACAENVAGQREVPDHPLVQQTVHDCLYELMDIEGLEALLRRIANNEVAVLSRELTSPSPLAQEVVSARPYAFLDDAPAEERRTQAILSRHLLDPEDAAELAQLDPAAIETVCEEAWPDACTPDELHDGLVLLGFMTEQEGRRGPLDRKEGQLEFGWNHMLQQLIEDRRATTLSLPSGDRLWVSAERLAELQLVCPQAALSPAIQAVSVGSPVPPDREEAIRELIRSRLEALGPVQAVELARPLGLSDEQVQLALLGLEQEGFVMRGSYRALPDAGVEWCERRLLARIHRRTMKRLRREIEPVSPAVLMRFLFAWHGMSGDRAQGVEALRRAVDQLEGFPAPAASWENVLLPARLERYSKHELDQLVGAGLFLWLRPSLDQQRKAVRPGPVRNTPIVIVPRENATQWHGVLTNNGLPAATSARLSTRANRLRDTLQSRGALFFADLVKSTGLIRTEVELALAELVAAGLVTADSFAGLRALVTPASRKGRGRSSRRPQAIDAAGRWDLIERSLDAETGGAPVPVDAESAVRHIAGTLLNRYGVMFRSLLLRESKRLPPWRDLARVYRRMEARGEIRGGRFVTGFSGEQFALPDAVAALRATRRQDPDQHSIVIGSADPLNLSGIITPGMRVPATSGNRLLYRDGVVVAVQASGRFQWFAEPDPEEEWAARNMLLRHGSGISYLPTAARLS